MVARMEKRLEALRQFQSPFAPSVGLIGARLKSDQRRIVKDPIYVFGKGSSLTQALGSLYGEAAERDGLYLRHGDTIRTRMNGDLQKMDSVPADTVLHADRPEDLGSTGCAAHTDFEIAARSAIWELIERYAVQLWWTGQTHPISLDGAWSESAQLSAVVQSLRSGASLRRSTLFYSLPCPGPMRVVMARSEEVDGSEITIAFATADTMLQAAQRAALELMSVELEAADLKAGLLRGDLIEPGSDRALVARRQKALKTTHAKLFDTCSAAIPKDSPRVSSLSALAEALAIENLAILLVDLSRDDINLPTCRAMFEDPQLQPRFPKRPELSPL